MFSPSKWLVRILRAIIGPTANLVTVGVADLFHRCGIRAKPVGDDGCLPQKLRLVFLSRKRSLSGAAASDDARCVARAAMNKPPQSSRMFGRFIPVYLRIVVARLIQTEQRLKLLELL